jgi:hypothetical protein
LIRRRGFSTDDQENEIGINFTCRVGATGLPVAPWAAIGPRT